MNKLSQDEELVTVVKATEEKVFWIPGASLDAAGFVGDYRPLSVRQADPSTPKYIPGSLFDACPDLPGMGVGYAQ